MERVRTFEFGGETRWLLGDGCNPAYPGNFLALLCLQGHRLVKLHFRSHELTSMAGQLQGLDEEFAWLSGFPVPLDEIVFVQVLFRNGRNTEIAERTKNLRVGLRLSGIL